MDPKKELQEIINASSLAQADKKMWEKLLEKAPEDFAFSILDLLKDNPKELTWFNDIYKRKSEVFELSKKDPEKAKEMFHEIVEEEKKKIEELNSNKE